KGKPDFTKLFKGQEVTLRGRFSTDLTLFGHGLDECGIVKAGPSPSLIFTADELVQQWTKDKAVGEKWHDKPVIVSGEVASVGKPDPIAGIRVSLKGVGGKRLDCTFSSVDDYVSKYLKPGARARIVGEFDQLGSESEGVPLVVRSILIED